MTKKEFMAQCAEKMGIPYAEFEKSFLAEERKECLAFLKTYQSAETKRTKDNKNEFLYVHMDVIMDIQEEMNNLRMELTEWMTKAMVAESVLEKVAEKLGLPTE